MSDDERPRSLPSQSFTVKLPTKALTRAKGEQSNNGGAGPLGNSGELRKHLAKACVESLGELLEDSQDVVITPDGDVVAKDDTPERDDNGRWT